ncbi:hypothetical protein EBQ25_09510 [Allofranklinella schreckenbergeri]|uniref:Uncharacterized protein n=1 Tax=Allofranklinella schreckenbergeri TaxID=1076744 RepID=A0A3M6Q3K0_9BURK|nr:hypothetical protein [Allofranklinella schreckenbergeri]RMW97782.1 hypothetical protein EBQ25_09510 [Allofranklinella schreckenbergeri]
MKKNVFALSVATALAALAGSANAQVPFLLPNANGSSLAASEIARSFKINDGGVGHILLAPYYTVQGARNTLLNIVNTDTINGKAVKVRFRGARNSDDVFDFYVFLSPGDMWRSRVYRKGEQTFIDVPDTSCTLPSKDVVTGTPFKTVRVYKEQESEVREGYIELLTAADIPPGSDLYKNIKHDFESGAVECKLAPLVNSMVRLTDVKAAKDKGLDFPSAGLIGHWAVVDVQKLTAVGGGTTAVLAVNGQNGEGDPARGSIVVAPQDAILAPADWTDVAKARKATDPLKDVLGTTDPLLTGRTVQAQNFDFPDLSTPYVAYSRSVAPAATAAAHQVNQLSSALAVTKLVNEFSTGMGADLKTDWVFSMPTRRYGVAIDYATGAGVQNDESAFFSLKNNVLLVKQDGIPHLEIGLNGFYYDNNERSLLPDVSPAKVQRLAGEVNVLTFNNDPVDSVLGAQISAQRVNPLLKMESIPEGWAYIDLKNDFASSNGKAGLPVIGYAAITGGSSALGFTWPHRYTK